MKLTKLANTKPVVIIGLLVSLHTFIYGVGYLFGIGGFPETILYPAIQEIMPHAAFGAILLVISAASAVAWLKEMPKWISRLSSLQAVMWLFVFFVYVLDGSVLLGFAIGMIWTVISGYSAYVYTNKVYTRYDEDL